VSYGNEVPLSIFAGGADRVQAFGTEADEQGVITLQRNVVAPGYFRLMGIPLLEGRDFTEQDDLSTEPVIVVNETFARRYFDGKYPIGRKVRVAGNWSTVVGMVKDSKYRTPAEGATAYFYGSFGQMFGGRPSRRSGLRSGRGAGDRRGGGSRTKDSTSCRRSVHAGGLFGEGCGKPAPRSAFCCLAAVGLYSDGACGERANAGDRHSHGTRRTPASGQLMLQRLVMTIMASRRASFNRGCRLSARSNASR
jgi:hypothetical protein